MLFAFLFVLRFFISHRLSMCQLCISFIKYYFLHIKVNYASHPRLNLIVEKKLDIFSSLFESVQFLFCV